MSKSEKIKGNILCDPHRTYSLCNCCLKCDCSWMRDCIPVNGWDAIKRPYSKYHGGTYTYHVFDCPLFSKKICGKNWKCQQRFVENFILLWYNYIRNEAETLWRFSCAYSSFAYAFPSASFSFSFIHFCFSFLYRHNSGDMQPVVLSKVQAVQV